MKPVIYCIEEFEYFNPYARTGSSREDIKFLFTISCREGTCQMDHYLSEMVEACKKHEPTLHHYLQNIWADMEEFYGSETLLMRGLEQDEFDVSRLLYIFMDNYDLEYLAEWIKKNGKNQPRMTADEIQKSWAEMNDVALFEMGEFLNLVPKISRKLYDAMKELALEFLPTLNLMETAFVRNLNKQLHNYSSMMVGAAVSRWENMDKANYFGKLDDEDDDEEYDNKAYFHPYKDDYKGFYSLEGQRQFYLKYRGDHPVEGCKSTPVFCVEILDLEEQWESRGRNHVRVWYKLTCAEGECCRHMDFENLMVEAMLNFPEIYDDAMLFYVRSNSLRPRHPAMVRGLKRLGHDLTPVLASYLASRQDFMPFLREMTRLNRLRNRVVNDYEVDREFERSISDPVYVEEFRIVNLLRDGLVNLGISIIKRELPELLVRADVSFWDYLGLLMHRSSIDPTNDLHHELESAFELRRGYKREYD